MMMRGSRSVLIVCVSLVVLAPSVEAFDLQLTLGLEGTGELDLGDLERNGGLNVGVELVQDLPMLEVGAGVEQSFSRDLDGGGDLGYTLVYGIARFNVLGPAFATVRYGYTDVAVDDIPSYGDDGGATWSLGGGFSLFDKLKAEALYTSIGGDLDYDSYQLRLIYNF